MVSTPDETRIDLLQRLLESAGVDVVRTGYDLTLPSPFKEKEKRRTEGSHYTDRARRLSVTVVQKDGVPMILWQCWYTKRKDGTAFGGTSAYAISVRTGMSQQQILERLDMRFDAEVAQAEEAEDKVTIIHDQSIKKDEDRRRKLLDASSILNPEAVQKQTLATPVQTLRNRQLPPNCVSLFKGLTGYADELILKRGVTPEVATRYELQWDLDTQAIIFPWKNRASEHVYHNWYSPDFNIKSYRFPPRETGLVSKEDAIFGINLWKPGLPLTLCEGVFDALSVYGCALGGSSLTQNQRAIILSLSPAPELLILALDKDSAGIQGAISISKVLRSSMPQTRIIITFPPEKDWNNVAQARGADAALQCFAESVRSSSESSMSTLVRQIALGR